MKKVLKGTYNVARSVVVTALVTIVALFALAYLLLLLPPVQNHLRTQGEKALSEYLNTDVHIGRVSIAPFNELTLNDVTIPDQQGDSLIAIDKLGAGISLKDLLADQRIVVTYAEVIGLKGHVTRPDKDSPTNLQFIIDAFKPKGDKPPKPFDVQVNNVVIRRSALSYDVLDQPIQRGQLDVNHVAVNNLRADLTLPHLKNNDFDIRVRRLSFDERSGLQVKHLSTNVAITDTALTASGIMVRLPNSNIALDDVTLRYSALNQLGKELRDMPVQLSTSGSTITPSDLAALSPQLRQFDSPLRVTATVSRQSDHIVVPTLAVHDIGGTLSLDARVNVSNPTDANLRSFNLDRLNLTASASDIDKVTRLLPRLSPQVRGIISRCGNVTVNGEAHGHRDALRFDGHVGTTLGNADINGTLAKQPNGTSRFTGHVQTDGLQVGTLLDKRDLLGDVALDANVDATLDGKDVNGHLDGAIAHVDFKGNRYHNITANVDKQGNEFTGTLAMDDPTNGKVNVDGNARLDGENSSYDVNLNADGLDLARLGVTNKYPDRRLTASANASLWGNSLANATGHVNLSNIDFTNKEGKGIKLGNVQVDADNSDGSKVINLISDHINGYVEGDFDYRTLLPTAKHLLSNAFPQFFGNYAAYTHTGSPNDLNFSFEINPDEDLHQLLNLPVSLVYKTTIEGSMSESNNSFDMTVDAPYMLQGNKIIEGTRLTASLDSVTNSVAVHAQSLYPSKNGKIALNVDATGVNDRLDANMGWRVQRDRDFHGNLDLSALLDRGNDGKIKADIDVNPSQLVFNDTAWTVERGHIDIDHGVITVDNLAGGHDEQYVRINGKASRNPDDVLCLELNDVSLDYVFETLAIDHVNFGGRATSKFYASDLFSSSPRLYTPGLHVQGITYNGALMGDADIKANYDNETRGVMLDADIAQSNGRHSNITGGIYIADDSLNINFDADHANVAFLKPYMEAFTSDVEGEVSGKANLFGNFHTINLAGDIVADTLRFLIDYVNVYYTCAGDSVHIVPDYITFNDIPIHDRDGHEARLDGWLKHDSFHRPEFNFAITQAHDFLCYDTNPSINPDWYGTIYGDGSCFVTGGPGIVTIKVNMESAPRSRFTFVMSDTEQADTYNFITFRDRNAPAEAQVTVEAQDSDIPLIVRQLTQRVQQEEESVPTAYTIDLQGDITPDVALTVIMDPVGGDRIKATGSGHLRLTYNNNGELAMYGKYTLDKGTYNFTLQDVIIKDFTIRDGSSISFQGDPYAAVLDLEAVYSLNANIKDLDESFAEDREINRTNVPVHALLRANGIISQPDISFDLEFPSLTTDAYRKVRSVISTDEMMNRQIIYLLALNRFYTPEYMGTTTTTQNEFITSVASSTISSQLSNILGKMTDYLSIAPNFRSDKGDFSDMEFDVALSSQLLNNRLLINGNLGYRDNTYNPTNTNFIGDFDIEYLLNDRGTLRLKAYNHFNDQNYYVRNALTTQGVGIVWKHDFDRVVGRKHQQQSTDSVQPSNATVKRRDTQGTPQQPADTVRRPAPMVTMRSANRNNATP